MSNTYVLYHFCEEVVSVLHGALDFINVFYQANEPTSSLVTV